jgi:hypothetical protein
VSPFFTLLNLDAVQISMTSNYMNSKGTRMKAHSRSKTVTYLVTVALLASGSTAFAKMVGDTSYAARATAIGIVGDGARAKPSSAIGIVGDGAKSSMRMAIGIVGDGAKAKIGIVGDGAKAKIGIVGDGAKSSMKIGIVGDGVRFRPSPLFGIVGDGASRGMHASSRVMRSGGGGRRK